MVTVSLCQYIYAKKERTKDVYKVLLASCYTSDVGYLLGKLVEVVNKLNLWEVNLSVVNNKTR